MVVAITPAIIVVIVVVMVVIVVVMPPIIVAVIPISVTIPVPAPIWVIPAAPTIIGCIPAVTMIPIIGVIVIRIPTPIVAIHRAYIGISANESNTIPVHIVGVNQKVGAVEAVVIVARRSDIGRRHKHCKCTRILSDIRARLGIIYIVVIDAIVIITYSRQIDIIQL